MNRYSLVFNFALTPPYEENCTDENINDLAYGMHFVRLALR